MPDSLIAPADVNIVILFLLYMIPPTSYEFPSIVRDFDEKNEASVAVVGIEADV